ncbi:MAG: homoserine kinase [Mariprofundus sp.]|nr:homoserine kinase [Mariprofundus sp.]
MSVYTELTHNDIQNILSDYQLGALIDFEGIAAGIENSNFFIITDSGRYVLTIFERLDATELPYFMCLMKHLAGAGLCCPDVMQRHDDSLLFQTHGKQGCIVSCLTGKTLEQLNKTQLHNSGRLLAQLHLAGSDFNQQRVNPTGMAWLIEMSAKVLQKTETSYGTSAAKLLADELKFQRQYHWDSLPSGVIHGDLFVDNILFEAEEASGMIDFYYAHTAPFAMDIAITLNAQAILLGEDDDARMDAFLTGYESLRPLQADEHQALPQLLRLAALRFWVSRLYDAIYPRGGSMTQTKDPQEYQRKLSLHRQAVM